MLSAARISRLEAGSRSWAGGRSTLDRLPPLEGGFQFDDFTIGIVLSNQLEHWASYGSDRKRKLPLLTGDCWIFPAGMGGHCQWKAPQTMINVQVERSMFEKAEVAVPGEQAHRVGPADPLVSELILNLHDAPKAASDLYRESLTLALAAHVGGIAPDDEPAARRTDKRIGRSLAFLEAHLAEDIALDALAAEAAMSPFHFTRTFKQQTGHSPYQFIIQKRMQRARSLLKSTPRTVADIAWELGYQDVSRFGELFKRHTGMTPAAYRSS